jgi:DtxR family Mn-dependent transcriptional regulator
MFTILQVQEVRTLFLGLLFVAALLWFLWPTKGILALIAKLNKSNKRVILEDALKFIFDCEYKKVICDANSIAGHLNIRVDKAGRLINSLSALDLITLNNKCGAG